jgi:hypothetical protein
LWQQADSLADTAPAAPVCRKVNAIAHAWEQLGGNAYQPAAPSTAGLPIWKSSSFCGQQKTLLNDFNRVFDLVARAGFEPTTFGL